MVVRRRALVLDDYPDAATSLGMLLEALGMECRMATRGLEALDIATTFLPDVGLIDLDLPDVHGFEVARRLRTMAGRRPLFLVAITGSDRPGDRVQALAAGFDHHILKPIDAAITARLITRAETYLEQAGAAARDHSSRSR